tara:strand:- start:448 stop:717 length:270 start_codon:yes stop_codon:yes gene_type:complete
MKTVVLIEWLDAESSADERWLPNDEAFIYAKEPLRPCFTVGFLLDAADHHVTVATSNGGDQIGTIWKIPRGMIREVKTIYELGEKGKES